MIDRPPIGAHVRLLSNTGLTDVTSRTGVVLRHHADGITFSVLLDNSERRVLVDPIHVRLAAGEKRRLAARRW